MDIKKEIAEYSDKSDVACLEWLFSKYHMSSQWSFVACCKFIRYGELSYQVNRKWTPTKEGRLLFKHREEL